MGGVRATAAIRKRSLQRVYPIASPQSPANRGGFRIPSAENINSAKSDTQVADGVSVEAKSIIVRRRTRLR